MVRISQISTQASSSSHSARLHSRAAREFTKKRKSSGKAKKKSPIRGRKNILFSKESQKSQTSTGYNADTEVKRQDAVQFRTQCRPGQVKNVINSLSEEQRDVIKSMGFDGICNIRCSKLKRSLVLWMVNEIEIVDNGMLVKKLGHFTISYQHFGRIMGIPYEGKKFEFVDFGPHPSHSWEYIRQNLCTSGMGNDFKFMFLELVFAGLFDPDNRPDGKVKNLKALGRQLLGFDVSYNWSEYFFHRLVKGIAAWKRKLCLPNLHLKGCLLFLQFFYLIHVQVQGVPKRVQISDWTESNINSRLDFELERNGDYGKGMVEDVILIPNLPNVQVNTSKEILNRMSSRTKSIAQWTAKLDLLAAEMDALRRQIGQANIDNTRDIQLLIDAAPSVQVASPNVLVHPDTNAKPSSVDSDDEENDFENLDCHTNEVRPDTSAKPSLVDSDDKEENPFGNLDCHTNEAAKDPFTAPPSPSNTTGDGKGDPSDAFPSPTCFIAPLNSVGAAHRGTRAPATLSIPPLVSADESSKKGEDKVEQGPVFDSAYSDTVCAEELTPVGFIDITTESTNFHFGSPVFDSSISPLPKFPSTEKNSESFIDILQPVTDAIENGKGDPVSAINNELMNASVENKQKYKDLMGQSFTLDDDPMGTSTLNAVIAEVDEIYRQVAHKKNVGEKVNEQEGSMDDPMGTSTLNAVIVEVDEIYRQVAHKKNVGEKVDEQEGSMEDLSLKSVSWDENRSHEIPTFNLFKTRSKRKGKETLNEEDSDVQILRKKKSQRTLNNEKVERSAFVNETMNKFQRLKPMMLDVPVIPEEEVETAHHAFLNCLAQQSEVIVSCDDLELTRKDVRCLEKEAWISTEVVHAFVNFLNIEEESSNDRKRFFMNPYFSSKLYHTKNLEDNKSVMKNFGKLFQTLNPNPFDCRGQVYFPLCEENHWALVVLDIEHKEICSIDSLQTAKRRKIMTNLCKQVRFCMDIISRESGYLIDISKFKEVPKYCLKQKNGNECGVILLKMMQLWTPGHDVDLNIQLMQLYRVQLAAQLCLSQHNKINHKSNSKEAADATELSQESPNRPN